MMLISPVHCHFNVSWCCLCARWRQWRRWSLCADRQSTEVINQSRSPAILQCVELQVNEIMNLTGQLLHHTSLTSINYVTLSVTKQFNAASFVWPAHVHTRTRTHIHTRKQVHTQYLRTSTKFTIFKRAGHFLVQAFKTTSATSNFHLTGHRTLITVRVTRWHWSTDTTTLHYWSWWGFLKYHKHNTMMMKCSNHITTWGITKVPAELERLWRIL